eukprot:COSAG05_NODE_1082_length_5937_cov_2.133265_4_plen_74_part_00
MIAAVVTDKRRHSDQIVGAIVGNVNTQMTIEGNTIIATANGTMGSFLATQGGTLRNNSFLAAEFAAAQGVYFW